MNISRIARRIASRTTNKATNKATSHSHKATKASSATVTTPLADIRTVAGLIDSYKAANRPTRPTNAAITNAATTKTTTKAKVDYVVDNLDPFNPATYSAQHDDYTMMGFCGPWYVMGCEEGNGSGNGLIVLADFNTCAIARDFLAKHEPRATNEGWYVITPRYADGVKMIECSKDVFVNAMPRYRVTRSGSVYGVQHFATDSRDHAITWCEVKVKNDAYWSGHGAYAVWDMTNPIKPVAVRK